MAVPLAFAEQPCPVPEPDQRVILHGVAWEQFELFLEMRGDEAGVRLTYLDGELELLSPSINHELLKKLIARLIEMYAFERGIELEGYGSWTVRKRDKRRGVEPDECYVVGTHEPDAPDLAIEVVWTSGGLDKLEVYRGLGVREVWLWRDGAISVHRLRRGRYVVSGRSDVLPDLDLDLLVRCLDAPSQTAAVRQFVEALRVGEGGG